jgi:thioredoxin reductase (NADPH)
MSESANLEETADTCGAFPRLSEDQIALLAQYGRRRSTAKGEILIHEGDRDRDLLVVLAGTVAVVAAHGSPDQRVLRVHGPGRFLDELGLLTGQPSFVTYLAREPGEILAVSLDDLRRLIARDPHLGDFLLSALLIRREMLIDAGAGLRIIGSRFSPDSRRLREFAARNRLPHRWIDLEADPEAEELLRRLGVAPAETPVVIWRGTQVLRNPSSAELARLTGFDPPARADAVYDLVVIGAGPAGLGAAVYGASEGLSTVVLDAIATGGQAGTSARIENYLGFPAGISGGELAERAMIQAEKFGAAFRVPVEARDLQHRDGYMSVRLDGDAEICARSVVIATGARYRRLEVPRLGEFEGKSVYYAATIIEAQSCRRLPVVVVGGGNSAGQAAVFLSDKASRVHLLVRDGDLTKTMSRYLIDQVERIPNVGLLCNTEIRELIGEDGQLEAVVAEDNCTGRLRTLEASNLFVFIGAQPCTGWLAGRLALDDHGFILTGADAATADPAEGGPPHPKAAPNLLETHWPGVLAVGDVRSGSTKRLTSAVGEGALAVRLIHDYLARTS